MCGSIFFRKVGRAMMKKENKKTEPDVKNNDRQKEKKSVKLGSMAPALSAILVVACAGASVAAYTPKVYAVQKAAPKATESDTVEDTTAEEMNLEGQVFDLPDGIYEGTGTGFSFTNYNAHEMLATVRNAERVYYDNKREWNKMVDRAMAADFSWSHSAKQYEEMYNWLIGDK